MIWLDLKFIIFLYQFGQLYVCVWIPHTLMHQHGHVMGNIVSHVCLTSWQVDRPSNEEGETKIRRWWQGMVVVRDTQYCMARYGGCQGHTILYGKVWWLSGTHNTVWQGMGVSVIHNTVWQGMVGVSDTQYCMAKYGGVSDTQYCMARYGGVSDTQYCMARYGVSVTHNTVWQGMVGVSDTQYCMARYGGCQWYTILYGKVWGCQWHTILYGKVWWVSVIHNTVWQGMVGVRDTQ